VVQVDARADVIGDYVYALAKLWLSVGLAQINLAVLFAEAADACVGILNDVAEAGGLGGDHPPIHRERLAAGVEHDFAGDGVADDGAFDTDGTLVERAIAAGAHARVVVDVG